MIRFQLILALLALSFSAKAQDITHRPGLLVMAHGGSEEWNEAVLDAVMPLTAHHPVAVAFGMANPETLQEAADELVDSGVSEIHVVRLFISGDSFLAETEYAFSLSDQAPEDHYMHEPRPINLSVPVSLSSEGLVDIVSLGGVLKDRAKVLSMHPRSESVFIIGHGPGSDEENERWLQRMDRMADSVRAVLPFHSVQVETLREDWTGKREEAEERIRTHIQKEVQAGRTVLVIPFRLHGFGPYAEVLEGLDYRSDGMGFLPDSRITDWIKFQFDQLVSTQDLQTGVYLKTPLENHLPATRLPDTINHDH